MRSMKRWIGGNKPSVIQIDCYFSDDFLFKLLNSDILYGEFSEVSNRALITNESEKGYYIDGIYLENCRWNRKNKRLEILSPSEIYLNNLYYSPVVHLSASPKLVKIVNNLIGSKK